jgi:hypothetical protein
VLTAYTLPRRSSIHVLTHELKVADQLKPGQWDRIAGWVGDFPLALELLHWALDDGGLTPTEALRLADTSASTTTSLDPQAEILRGQVPDEFLRSITDAFRGSYDALDPHARTGAELIAHFAPTPIPIEVVGALGGDVFSPATRALLHRRNFVVGGSASPLVYGSMHAVLADFLVHASGPRSSDHWFRAAEAVGKVIETKHEHRDEALVGLCVPHATHLLERGTKDEPIFSNSRRVAVAVDLAQLVGDVERDQGALGASRELLERARAVALGKLSDPHRELGVLYSYCRTLEEQGDQPQLRTELKALMMLASGLFKEDPIRFGALLMRGRLLVADEDWSGAEKTYREILKSSGRRPQDLPPLVDKYRAFNDYAAYLAHRGKDAIAIKYYEKLLDHYRSCTGEESEETLRTKNNLAHSLLGRRRGERGPRSRSARGSSRRVDQEEGSASSVHSHNEGHSRDRPRQGRRAEAGSEDERTGRL